MTTSFKHHPRIRRGRLLVECLVAMLLLSVTTLVVTALAHGASWSAQRARHTTAAWALATRQVESAENVVCTPHTMSGGETQAPLTATWHDGQEAGWTERTVTVTSAPSPLQGRPLQLSFTAAWSCP